MSLIDTELFISAVKKYPPLYNTKLKEYSDKNLKKKLWIEVFQQLIDNWNELETAEKEKKGQELQGKWKNLRTCFKREYDAQKKSASGAGSKKRHKYIYYDQLLFLVESVESRPTSSSAGINSYTDDVQSGMKGREEPIPLNTLQSSTLAKRNITPTNRKKASQKSYKEAILQILRETKDEDKEIDEDKYFLLSLLPSFKKFNEDQKFIAKTEFLNVMRRVRLSGSNYPSPCGYNASQYFPMNINTCQSNNTAQHISTSSHQRGREISPLQTPDTQDSSGNTSEVSSLFNLQ